MTTFAPGSLVRRRTGNKAWDTWLRPDAHMPYIVARFRGSVRDNRIDPQVACDDVDYIYPLMVHVEDTLHAVMTVIGTVVTTDPLHASDRTEWVLLLTPLGLTWHYLVGDLVPLEPP